MLNERGNVILITIIVVLLLILVGGGAYLIGKSQKESTLPQATQQNIITSNNSSIPNPTSSPISQIPADWTINKNTTCSVNIPLPPKQIPYMESKDGLTEFWQYKTGNGGQYFDLKFDNTATATYVNDQGLGSDYVAGQVFISCSNNSQNYTSQSYADYVASVTKNITMFMGEPVTCTPTQEKMSLWNKEIIAVSSNCQTAANPSAINDTFYVFADTKMTTLVTKKSQSTNPVVNETTDKIFNNLQFTN